MSIYQTSEFLYLSWIEDILKNAVIKQLLVPIDFRSISFPTMDVHGDQQLFFKISSVFNIRKKHAALVRVRKWW